MLKFYQRLAVIFILMGLPGCFWESSSPRPTDETATTPVDTRPAVQFTTLPSSEYHQRGSTWWGYNQSKIVRYQDHLYTYYVDNHIADSLNPQPYRLKLLHQVRGGSWNVGPDFPVSVPGNLQIDSDGVLTLFVFEPTVFATNPSWGRLVAYTFPQAGQGDLTHYSREVIIDNDGSHETVNIRLGSAISPQGTLGVAFGLYTGSDQQTEQWVYRLKDQNSPSSWTTEIAARQLGHDLYYPMATFKGEDPVLLAIQDDLVTLGESNIYQFVQLFFKTVNQWYSNIELDLRTSTLASQRRILMEHTDLVVDTQGRIHELIKVFDEPSATYMVNRVVHRTQQLDGTWSESNVDTHGISVRWIKLIEVNQELCYLILSSNSRLYVSKVSGGALKEIKTTGDMPSGGYLYITRDLSRTTTQSQQWDILLIEGFSGDYPYGKQVVGTLRLENLGSF